MARRQRTVSCGDPGDQTSANVRTRDSAQLTPWQCWKHFLNLQIFLRMWPVEIFFEA